MEKYNIALLPGDGIGYEIARETVKVLNAVANFSGIIFSYTEYPFGAEHYLSTGEVIPDSAIDEFKDHDAIFFGASGDPRVPPGILETGMQLKIRFELDQYINLRPCKLLPQIDSPIKNVKNIEMYIVRENTEDFYLGKGCTFKPNQSDHVTNIDMCNLNIDRASYNARIKINASLGANDAYAINVGLITSNGAERVIRYGFELAQRKKKQLVTSIDKANVITDMYQLWREEFSKVAADYPNINTEFTYADAFTMWAIKNPEKYEVVVAPNLFGDIISDLGAVIVGGLGFSPSANINPHGTSMFEPVHGSSPKYKGLNIANPIASILSGALMLEELGEENLSGIIEQAINRVLMEKSILTRDMGGNNATTEMGDAIVEKINDIGASLE